MAKRPYVQYVRYYVDGTAAKKLEPVAPVSTAPTIRMPAVRRKKRKVVFVDPVALVGTAVAVCLLICMLVGFVQLRQAQREAAIMEQYVSQELQKNAELTEKYSTGYNLYEVEQTALALGMVPGDTVRQTEIVISEPEPEEPASIWAQMGTFLAGLFA